MYIAVLAGENFLKQEDLFGGEGNGNCHSEAPKYANLSAAKAALIAFVNFAKSVVFCGLD